MCECVSVCVLGGEIRWKRGHSLLPEIFTTQHERPDQKKMDDGDGPGKKKEKKTSS